MVGSAIDKCYNSTQITKLFNSGNWIRDQLFIYENYIGLFIEIIHIYSHDWLSYSLKIFMLDFTAKKYFATLIYDIAPPLEFHTFFFVWNISNLVAIISICSGWLS